MSKDEGNHRQAFWQQGFVRDLTAVALLSVLCLLFFWRIITPNELDRGSFRQGDFYDQFYAFAAFEHDRLSQGELPLWNPHTFSGHPFLADVQSAVFYPLSLLIILLGAAWHFSAFVLEIEAIAHFFLAGVFTYFFARRLLQNRAGALISAVTFAFGGYLTSFPPLQLAILESVIWLPLILLFLDLGVTELLGDYKRRLAFCYLLMAGLTLGVTILAGHPQSAMYVFYVAVLYFSFKVWYIRRISSGGVTPGRVVIGLAIFVLAGAGLAAAQILPSWEFMRLSSRPELGYQELSGGFAYLDFVQIVLPHATGFWSPLYVGIFPFLLGLYALSLLLRGRSLGQGGKPPRRWRAEIAFWSILAGIALLLTVGDDSFLYSLFYLFVPGFGMFRAQERAALVFSLALSLLAGYGFTALLLSAKEVETRVRSYHAFLKVIVAVGLGMAALLAMLLLGRSAADAPPASLMDALFGIGVLVALLLAVSTVWLFVWRRLRGHAVVVTTLALAIIFFDLFTVNARPNVQKKKIENQYAATGVIRELQTQPGTFRVYDEWRLPGNYGSVFGIEDTWGASPLRLASYERFIEQVPQERAWELLNVGYVVTWLDDIDAPSELVFQEPAKKGETTYLHRLEEEHPRVWLVYEVEIVSGEDEALARLAQPDFRPYSVALLTEPPMSGLAGRPVEQSQARIVGAGTVQLQVEVDQAANGLLVFSEIDYPGWKATIDGKQVPILRTDAILRAVEVPAGQHRVEMRFEPLSVKAGLAISGFTLALILACSLWCLIGYVQERNAP